MSEPWEILQGDVRERLADLPDGHFHVCCTSPPYFALRSYLPKGHPLKHLELGAESVPDCFAWARGVPRCDACYVCCMTDVFAAVRRTLRDDGTLWVNVAGSYASGASGGRNDQGRNIGGRGGNYKTDGPKKATPRRAPDGWRPKDYVNVPALLAESLRCDGWYLRAEVSLTKVAPMPESCRDRPTRAHEKLYLFAKRGRYFYDQEAERHAISAVTLQRDRYTRITSTHEQEQYAVAHDHETPSNPNGRNLWDYWGEAPGESDDDLPPAVWPWRPEPSKVKHYATFPLWLPLRVIRLATSAAGCCSRCGGPYRRVVERKGGLIGKGWTDHAADLEMGSSQCYRADGGKTLYQRTTLGWSASCKCDAPTVPARVLDCFSGTATTGVAARLQGRHYCGIELSGEYCTLARGRLETANPLDDAAWRTTTAPSPPQPSLFPEDR